MPGIVGIIERHSRKESAGMLQAMLKCMIHEKFYTSGTYFNPELKIRCGWTTLKNSFADCMPIWNENRDICLIFTGENAIDQADIDKLKTKGHQFDPNNASYLVHMYEETGLGFFEKLNGSFSGILLDLREGKGILFNDRYGLNRIYYHENTDGLYFSSEAKSLLKVLPNLRQIDPKSFGEFFSCGCVLENRSLFPGIALMPGGSAWEFSAGHDLKMKTYFQHETWENQTQLTEQEYYSQLQETLIRIMPRYFSGSERVALSLTGGIDTRMILACCSLPPFKVPCYTFGGIYRDCADVKVARKVAETCQQKHSTIAVNKKFFSEFPALAKRAVYYTDGAMDVSGAVELFVNRLAKEIAPVRLTGNYGDQVVRQLVGFKPKIIFNGVFNPEFEHHIQAGCETYDRIAQDRELSFWAFKQVPWHHYSRAALERSQLTTRSPFLDNDLIALAYQAPPDFAKSRKLSLRLIEDNDPSLSKIPTDRGELYRSTPLLTPLRHFYGEFMFKAEYAYDYGMPQWLVKLDHHFARLRLERLFLGQNKFYHFRIWYRDELSKYVQDILLDPRTLNRPYLQGKRVEEMVKGHISGQNNYTTQISFLLTSELIQRQFIEQT